MGDSIPIGSAFDFGWEKMKGNLRFFLISYIVAGLCFLPAGLFLVLTAVFAAKSDWVLTAIFAVLMVIAYIVPYVGIFIGYLKAGIRICSGEELHVKDCLPTVEEWFKVFIANCIYFTMVGVGLLLCVLPGIWLAVKFWSYGWFIVAEGSGPIEAFKEAEELTSDLTFDFLVFFVLCGVVLAIGWIALLIGLAFAFPVVLIATTYVFAKSAGIAAPG